MHAQRPAIREKITPKKPTWKVIKKRKRHHSRNIKEDTLTENQQAWARALTVSLSGWRNRQWFYKNHTEAQLRAEPCSNIAKTYFRSQEVAESESEEKDESSMQAILQAKAEEDRAEAWAHKARAMHMAGRGVRKQKQQYFGWDPEEKEYLRNLALEDTIAERRSKRVAERKARFKADNSHSEDENSHFSDSDEFDSDSSDSIELLTPNGSDASLVRPPPVPERAKNMDWREKAQVGVIRKKLSVTKEWSMVTWNQKSNIQERLLVLETDGYDIQALLDGKSTSEQVTSIILERAAAKQQRKSQSFRFRIQPRPSKSSQGGAEDLTSMWLDPALRNFTAHSPDQVSPPNAWSPPPTLSSSGSTQTKLSNSMTVDDNTQLFSFGEAYIPQPSRDLKHQREADEDSDTDDEAAVPSPAYKKRKLDFVEEGGMAAQALKDMKQAVIRAMYRPARPVNRGLLPSSRVIFTAEIQPDRSDRSEHQVSSLRYLYPESFKPKTEECSYRISTCAFDNTVSEIRFLANTSDRESTINIYDPDFEDNVNHAPTMREESIRQETCETRREASRILITTEEGGQTSLQGDALILAELLNILSERELLHCVDWEWDGLRLRRADELSWYLSPQTHSVFATIENQLRRCQGNESVEVIVYRLAA